MYEVKRARAVWDPSLSVPGTNRRGGYRCPVGTRYGGQITDRFGRNCGWGVARRLANEISDLGERLENVGDRHRERKLRKRNERMAGRLAGQAGALERIAGRIGDAADVTGREGGRRNRVGAEAPRPAGRIERAAGRLAEAVDPDRPRQGRARRAEAPQAPQAPAAPSAPRGRRQVQAEPRPRPAAARRPRRNLRESEARRMQREIDAPGAARTDEAAPAARPAPRPRPAAPRRPASAGRRQPAEARRTPTPVPAREATPVPSARPATPQAPRGESDNAARSAAVRARELSIPENGLKEQQLREILGDKFNQQEFDRLQAHIEWQRNEGLPNDMAAWGRGDIAELESVIKLREQAIQNERSGIREAARLFNNEPNEANASVLMQANMRLQTYRDGHAAMKRRLAELRNPQAEEPNIPEPSPMPQVPNPPAPSVPSAGNREPSLPPQPARVAPNDDVRGRTESQWRQFFEAQNEEDIPLRIQRAQDAARVGTADADADFNNNFRGGGDAMRQIRDRDEMVRQYERRLAELERAVEARRSAYDAANPERRDDYRMAQRDLIQAIAKRDRYRERRAEIDAVLAQPAPEPLNPEMAAKAEQRVKDAIDKRQRILAEHLNREYGPGNAPWKDMTPERRAQLVRAARNGDNAAKRELHNWAKAMYGNKEIQGNNGKTYRTVVRSVTGTENMSVNGHVEVKNADGTWEYIGYFDRNINAGGDNVYNARFFIERGGEAHKNNGIQTILNQKAFMYAKAAGFKEFGVTAASDGPYVWGRIGFQDSQNIPAGKVGNMARELAKFRAGEASIIKNEEDANIIDYLIQKHADNPASVRHMDFIYALSNTGTTQATKRARDTELRNWFVSNMSFSNGRFDLDRNMIKADPRD